MMENNIAEIIVDIFLRFAAAKHSKVTSQWKVRPLRGRMSADAATSDFTELAQRQNLFTPPKSTVRSCLSHGIGSSPMPMIFSSGVVISLLKPNLAHR